MPWGSGAHVKRNKRLFVPFLNSLPVGTRRLTLSVSSLSERRAY